jgi:type II restriction/modification system DNA methylase subunit YeeA
MDLIRVHTNWTNTVQEVHDFTLDDLLDGAKRERLKQAFTDPESFRPQKTRQALTEETAREFAGLAQRLRDRGHEAHRVAHFVNRLVFCMFAEDVGLLPDHLFTKMLEVSRRDPKGFEDNARTLFGAMANKGGKVGFAAIDWFNGGLFEDDHVLPVSTDDIDELIKAARRDWSQIDPSILGTLFERGLDPDKRSQLGAHYTDREKIMMIVRPVIIEPLEAEWAAVKEQIAAAMARVAEARSRAPSKQNEARKVFMAARRAEESARREAVAAHRGFIERMRNFRVLDPACGSGNFLYLALKSLKDIEHAANLDAEALGLQRLSPEVGPECVLGIELNPYAAELARVSVWIGEIQWMRAHGFEASRNPILRPLDTIGCRDAVLVLRDAASTGSAAPQDERGGPTHTRTAHPEEGLSEVEGPSRRGPTRAEWPAADVIIGNPPFLGNKKMIRELGEDYTLALRKAWPEVPGGVDLVCYWFAKAWAMIVSGRAKRAGLVATNSIRGGANREVLKPIVEHGRIFEAWSDEQWTVEGAAVRVSLVCFDGEQGGHAKLDRRPVSNIHSDLTGGDGIVDLTKAVRLRENADACFEGMKKYGPFDIDGDVARQWLREPVNVNGRPNADVIFPWIVAVDLVRRPLDRWAIDFGPDALVADAACYEKPYEYAEANVLPARAQDRNERTREQWWRYERARPELRQKLQGLTRYIATPVVAKHRIFIWLPASARPSNLVDAIARDDDTSFGILHSRFHELWALRMGTSLEDRPRYTPSTTFETFPFPEGLTPDIPADYAADPRAQKIAAAAARLNELREAWLNPPDLVVREPEVVPGYPERILPKDEEAAKELKKRTLTNLYNARPQWLANAHAALDEAVAEAYGWGDDWRAGLLTDDEILARLFRLNQERAG